MKRVVDLKVLYFGTPVVLVSSLNSDGSTNIAPISSVWWLGQTAVLGMADTSQTVRNLHERPECVLNLVDPSMVAAVDRLALLTGRTDVPDYKEARGYRYEPDKFRASGLTPRCSDLVSPFGVAESKISLEGRVEISHQVGGSDSNSRAIEVSVLRAHVDDELLVPGHDHHIDALRWDPLIMKFTEFFAGGTPAYPSSLARGWGMPKLETTEVLAAAR
jgi:flavin reductase (DIM6/NTAB) family NADH-FMN oxidoreductase RutF